MEVSSRKPSKRVIEPVDEWLQNEGYYRKHAPKDPTCLFRAVSEQVYQNQRCHIRVREECIDFMKQNRQMFEQKISIPYDSYLDQMVCFTEWGSMNEISAMSLLYKRNVIIFHGQKLTREKVIDHGFDDNFSLCFTLPKQYETVYTQEYTANAGFCQSIVYQALYKNVFKMNNVDATVHKMLHERSNHLRHDKFFLKGNLDIRNQLTIQLLDKLEDNEDNEELQLLSRGITPFPYRVAKALDPNIYRNVDYDIWHEIRREVRSSGYKKFNSTELQAGAKCLVQVNLKENDKTNNNFLSASEQWDNNSKAIARPKRLEPLFYTGYIQEMGKNEGPVLVFIEELGQMVTVSYESLKPFPQRKVKQNIYAITSNKRNTLTQNNKWKKPWNSSGRRVKDQVSNDSTDKNKTSNSKTNNNNAINKSEWSPDTTLDNHSSKQQAENYTLHTEFNVNAAVDNVRNELVNTHISMVDAVDQLVADNKSKNSTVNNDIYEDPSKKSPATNVNQDPNQSNKQHNRIEKNEIFYPSYPNNSYPPNPRFSGDSEMVNYDLIKTMEVDGNGIPYSDPATVRHFFNLGVKYFWSQNIWANGNNGQAFGDNSYFVSQTPPDTNPNSNMMPGSIPAGENVNLVNGSPNNNNGRHNSRASPPRPRDQENVNVNGTRSGGQKSNYRGSEFRNSSTTRDYQQSTYTDINKNRVDCKNANTNEHQQQQVSNNKENQRGNKSSGVAPRFKRNYEGRNRNDHHNGQYHFRQQQQQQEYEFRNNKKQGELQISNQFGVNDGAPMQQQNQNSISHQQQQHSQQQQSSTLQPQASPPLNNSYSYPIVPYNQQVPYLPLNPYQAESEAYQGHYYSPPPSFVQVPYIPQSEVSESGNMGNVQQVYQTMDNYPTPYPPVYSQYVYHPPTMYPNQAPGAPIPENGYPPYNGQPYYFPYPPPPLPPNMAVASAQNPQSGPSH